MLIRMYTISAVVFILSACTKQSITVPSALQATISSDISVVDSTDQPGLYYDSAHNLYKLVLQPGEDGQDALIQWKADDPANANSNAGALDEIDAFDWTVYSEEVKGRSLIKFTGLNQIPQNAKIFSAQLFLFGTGSSIPTPQGNSGSNKMHIVAVTSPWDESTVTWNTQPTYTTKAAVTTPSSTSKWYSNTSADVTDLVKPMIRSAPDNNGFLMALVYETPHRSIIFASSENSNVQSRPKIVVVYRPD